METIRCYPKQVYEVDQAGLIYTLIPNHSSLYKTETKKEPNLIACSLGPKVPRTLPKESEENFHFFSEAELLFKKKT